MKGWNRLLQDLDQEIGKEIVNKWLRPLKILKSDAGNIHLEAKNLFQINWFKEHVSHLLTRRFLMASGKPIKVHFYLEGKPYLEKKKQNPFTEIINFEPDPLEPHATFDQYIQSQEEPPLFFRILKEISQENLRSYNPIYLYGPKGSGKSHLLMATAAALAERGKRCLFVRSETFTEHVIRAFRSATLQEFRKAYRNIEVLLIDDVHLFARKTTTQEELFHTFNRLHTSGFQIILSANVAPRVLEEIEERLISRFEWGLTLSIPSPSIEERLKILELRSQQLAFPLNEETKEFLIKIFHNLHSLIRALEALALRFPNKNIPSDLEIIKYQLQDLIDREKEQLLTPEKILKKTAHTFGIKTEDILGKGQKKEWVLPRQIAMYLCRNYLSLSYLKMARLFNRDHSTVISSIKRIKQGIEKREGIITLPLSEIEQKLNLLK